MPAARSLSIALFALLLPLRARTAAERPRATTEGRDPCAGFHPLRIPSRGTPMPTPPGAASGSLGAFRCLEPAAENL